MTKEEKKINKEHLLNRKLDCTRSMPCMHFLKNVCEAVYGCTEFTLNHLFSECISDSAKILRKHE